jgi:hypothetical protein
VGMCPFCVCPWNVSQLTFLCYSDINENTKPTHKGTSRDV